MREISMMGAFRLTAAFLVAWPMGADAADKVEVKAVTSASANSFGQEIRFPEGPGQVAVSMYEIPPGAALPVHKHPTPRIGYVVAGTLQVTNVENGETHVFKPGEVILESVERWHKGSNPGTDPLKLLVIDLQSKGAGNPTIAKP